MISSDTFVELLKGYDHGKRGTLLVGIVLLVNGLVILNVVPRAQRRHPEPVRRRAAGAAAHDHPDPGGGDPGDHQRHLADLPVRVHLPLLRSRHLPGPGAAGPGLVQRVRAPRLRSTRRCHAAPPTRCSRYLAVLGDDVALFFLLMALGKASLARFTAWFLIWLGIPICSISGLFLLNGAWARPDSRCRGVCRAARPHRDQVAFTARRLPGRRMSAGPTPPLTPRNRWPQTPSRPPDRPTHPGRRGPALSPISRICDTCPARPGDPGRVTDETP